MAILNSAYAFLSAVQAAVTSVKPPSGMWQWFILNVFSFVADYGWRIVVFTVLLKVVLSPLDFYQRYKMNKNQKIAKRLEPTMEKVQKQFGNDKQAFSQKQMELYRKEGYSYFSSCLPMILTLVIFITLWTGMQSIARYMTFREYTTMYDEYQYVYSQIYTPPESSENEEGKTEDATVDADGEEGAATDGEETEPTPEVDPVEELAKKIGQDVVYQMYYYGLDASYVDTLRANPEYKDVLPSNFSVLREGTSSIKKVQASFLWIKNIWAPDVPWGDQAVLSWTSFEKGIGDYSKASTNGLSQVQQANIHTSASYNTVMGKILSDKAQSRTNGYLVLPILVVLLSLASQLISSRQQKKAGQVNAQGGMATSMKVMMVFMPIMMAVFAVQYASIFALYMTINSATTLFFNFFFTFVIKLMDNRKQTRKYGIASGSTRSVDSSPIIHYVKGANPNAGAKPTAEDIAREAQASKKSKKAPVPQSRSQARSGRPDPNELMNMDRSSGSDKKK